MIDPTWRPWLARAGLGIALVSVAFLFWRGFGATHEVRFVYVLGDLAPAIATLDVALVDGERTVRSKTWSFSAAAPAPRALEDRAEMGEGYFKVVLVWSGPSSHGETGALFAVGEAGLGAPVVIALEANKP